MEPRAAIGGDLSGPMAQASPPSQSVTASPIPQRGSDESFDVVDGSEDLGVSDHDDDDDDDDDDDLEDEYDDLYDDEEGTDDEDDEDDDEYVQEEDATGSGSGDAGQLPPDVLDMFSEEDAATGTGTGTGSGDAGQLTPEGLSIFSEEEMTREESSSPFSGVRATEPFQFDNITFRESDALAAPLPPLSARKRRAMATHGDDDSEADFFDAYEEAPRNLTDAAQLRWRGHSRDSDRPDTFRGDRGAGAHAAARATAAAAAALDADFGEGVEDPEREGFRFSSGRRAR